MLNTTDKTGDKREEKTWDGTSRGQQWDRHRDTETGSGYLIVATVDHLHIG